MRRLIIWYGAVLIIAHLLTEAHSVLYYFYPNVATMRLDLFFTSEPMQIYGDGEPGLEFQWYLKMLSENFLLCVTYFVLANIAYRYSLLLFFIACIFFFYHLIDTFLFMYNYKKSASIYWVMLVAMSASVFMLFIKLKVYSYKSMI